MCMRDFKTYNNVIFCRLLAKSHDSLVAVLRGSLPAKRFEKDSIALFSLFLRLLDYQPSLIKRT